MPKVLPMPSGGAPRGRSRRVSTTLAEYNLFPLVDVMLLLLIIFMASAPRLQRDFEVILPQARESQASSSERLFVDVPLSFKADGNVFIGKEPIRLGFLEGRIKQALAT